MSEVVVLDAVGVAKIARAARDRDPGMLPDPIAAEVQRLGDPPHPDAVDHLTRYAETLDEIAETASTIDQHDHEIEHQLRWWGERAQSLEANLTGNPADDVETMRELALFRGRISGASTMRRHYLQQRKALVARHAIADAECASALAVL
ncbi:MAG: hypothetical protein ABI566_10230 [Pseudolysinimonas sp.]